MFNGGRNLRFATNQHFIIVEKFLVIDAAFNMNVISMQWAGNIFSMSGKILSGILSNFKFRDQFPPGSALHFLFSGSIK